MVGVNRLLEKKLVLDDIKWGEFELGSLFTIQKCKCNNASLLKKGGDTPYVGATNRNNGTMYFVESNEKLITKGCCLVFVLDGEGSMGTSFYKGEEFIGSSTLAAGYNENLNKYNGMFISTISDNVRNKYNFGYKRNKERLQKEKIILPVDINGNPDWTFMEQYMKQIEQEVKPEQLVITHKLTDARELAEVEWGEFVVEDIFEEVGSSPYSLDFNKLDERHKSLNEIAYVTRSDQNNGIANFVANMSKEGKSPIAGNCITIGLDTATVKYQYSSFYTGQNIHVVRDQNLNKYNALFMIPLIQQSLNKFGWGGYSATLGRFKKTKIMLPVKNRMPNWSFMEQYMKRLENELIEQVGLNKKDSTNAKDKPTE
jgi:hypothetical protein